MKSIIALSIFVLICSFKLTLASFPIILLPKIISLDTEEKITITSLDIKNDEHYDFEIRDMSVQGESFYKKKFKLNPNETKIIKFALTKYPTFGKVVISFTDDSTKKNRQNVVPVKQLNGITIIQTDKPIYTPKQEIKIRMLRLNKDFRPINDNLRLKIINPQNIIMENILFSKENQTSFFVDHYFFIPPAPLTGTWKVVVYQTEENSFNTTFEVQEYVLPTFSIELNATDLILMKRTKRLEGSAAVNYVYDKPVEGFITFKFGYADSNDLSKIEFIGKTKLKELYKGKGNFSFPISEFYVVSPSNLLGKRFIVEVEVNEFETGKKVKKIFQKGLFSYDAFKFSFEESINSFKPGLENKFVARLFYADGRIASDVAVNTQISEISLVKRLTSDKDGYLTLSFFPEDKSDEINVCLNTSDANFNYNDQLEVCKTLIKHESPTGGYLSITKQNKNYKVGDQFETDFMLSNIDHSQISSFYYHLVSPSGNLIDFQRIKYFEKIKFRIKNEYHPQITLILIGHPIREMMKNKTELKTNDLILTDTIQINVDLMDDCGIETRLFANDKFKDSDLKKVSIFEPGDKVSLEFSSTINQQLSLIGVDEAVYSLSANTLLIKNKLKKIYKENTLVCGEGGYSYSDILMNSGLILFDPDSSINHNPISSMCKGYVLNLPKSKKNDGLSKANNRIKRSNDFNKNLDDDYNYLNDKQLKLCCLLGFEAANKYSKYINKKCSKLEIFKKRINDTKCILAFNRCCLQSLVEEPPVFQKVSLSALSSSSYFPITEPKLNEFVHISQDDRLEKDTYIREDFRETWLFDIYPLEKNKPTNLTFKLPDSITTQSLSAFALSKETGICFFQEKPIRFRTFKDVFIQVLLPYQAVQNEQLEMIITVFNYHSSDQPIIVYFYGIEGICSEAETDIKSERKSLAVPSNSSKSVSIPLAPLQTGKFKIKIVAVSTFHSDVVIKELEVIPQGAPVEDDFSFQLDPKNKQKRARRHITTDRIQDKIIPEENSQFTIIKLAPNQNDKLIVPNSEQCIISAIADEYGPAMTYSLSDELASNEINKELGNKRGSDSGSVASLYHLIRKPRGCGEQTAYYYAPTLYTLIYMDSMNKLNPELKEKGINYLKSGYKRQLMFRKNDGSFSAFPNRRSSIWLTSFIMKLFCISSKYIEIDHQVIKTGLLYLFEKQDTNGYWNELNPVMHKSLIGGVNGRVPLTASILATLRVCSRIEQINLDINQELISSIQRAENFLHFYKDDIMQSKNAFKIALMANSLIDSLSYREHALELLNHLSTLANVDEDRNKISWNDDFPIEAASLVLLSLANIENQKLSLSPKLFANSTSTNSNLIMAKSSLNQLGRLLDDKKFIDKSDKLLKKLNPQSIVNYLNSQKTFTGGFDNTQNTILALNALSEHYRNQINSEQLSMNLNCDISTSKSRFKRNIQFNKENALVMKRLQVDQLDQLMNEELSFTTKGNGLGFMSVKLKYNVILPEKLCKFDLNIELDRFTQSIEDGSKRKKSGHVTENDKSKKNTLGLDDNESDSDTVYDKTEEFEKFFGKGLLDELGVDSFAITRARRNVKINDEQIIEKLNAKQIKRDTKKEQIDDEQMIKKFEKEFEKLKAKDDEQEELLLMKLDHHFELEEDNRKFKYEIVQDIDSRSRSKRSPKDHNRMRKKAKNENIESKSFKNKDSDIKLIADSTTPKTILGDSSSSSYLTYKLKICAQHIPNYDSEMTIVEIGLLTGFEVDEGYLRSKVYNPKENQTHTMTQLSKFEIVGRTVFLYLDSVPHGRPDCYLLKLFQTSQVSNLQSGVVKVYDYYQKDDSCTTLYSPVLIQHLNITCANKACICSVKKNCPDNKRIHDIIQISERDYTLGRQKFKDLVCNDNKLSYVFVGKVLDYRLIQNNLLFRIETLTNYRENNFKPTRIVVLVFNQECTGNLDMKVSDEPTIFFLNGTNFSVKSDNGEQILTVYPTRKSMIFNLSNDYNIKNYLEEINKQKAKGHLSC